MTRQHLINNTTEQRLLARLRNLNWKGESQLPLPPQSVIDFSARARQPDVTVRELSDVVECEPVLTAELLRNVNSCLRGLRQKVDSVPQAIALLGIPNSTTILLTSALTNAVSQMDSPLISAVDFRRETVERAVFAREMAKHLGLNSNVAYTATMLQDILLPVLTRRHQVDYHEYLHQTGYESIATFERDRFGWTHAEVTAKTLLDWGFSNTLALAVLQHHDTPEEILSDDDDEAPLGYACNCASLLSDLMRQSPRGVNQLIDLQTTRRPFQLMELAEKVDQAVSELEPTLHHPISLVHRLQHSMLNQLEERRQQVAISGRQFGNYLVEEKIKESTMGAIYKARHLHLHRPAAVKVLRADRTNRETITQFESEVRMTSQLRHPNTVSIFDFGRTPDDLFFYAMEFVDGLTLADLVKSYGALPDGRVLQILMQLCGSLSEAHGLNLIHRDIKPENIMVSNRANRPDHVTLLDFGLVASATPSDAGAKDGMRGIVGTPLYISPESALGRDLITPRSDLYSLAAVAYYLLTGAPVFRGNSVSEVLQQHLRWTPVPPTERFEIDVAPELEQLLMQCLQKDPVDRPASADELIERMTRITPRKPWGVEAGWTWWRNHKPSDQSAAPAESLEQTIQSTSAAVLVPASARADQTISL